MTDVCGKCRQEFPDEATYLAHVCGETGFTPADIEHQGKRAILIAKKALERTDSLTPEIEAQLDEKFEEIERT